VRQEPGSASTRSPGISTKEPTIHRMPRFLDRLNFAYLFDRQVVDSQGIAQCN
jgi:hypothetical protein